MANANLVTIPELTDYVDQRFFVAPLGGPKNPINYLDRFPEEVYNKAIDSHLVRFMYALLGPAGAGWLRKNYLEARLLFEDHGLELFDLDKFYGNPLGFGRILEEVYDEDPTGLLPRDKWEEIRAKDARYRNRAIDFLNGVRLGNTPEGMRLVARSGLGHEVEIVEHYKWLYDQLSDEPLFLDRYGSTNSTEEFVVVPRRVTSQSEVQTITITGQPTGGSFWLQWEAYETAAIDFNASANDVRQALENISSIGSGQIEVLGGPGPDIPFEVHFTGRLANRDVQQLRVRWSFPEAAAAVYVTTETGGTDATDEVVFIPDRDLRYLQGALDRIRPVATIPTVTSGRGLRSRQIWNETVASSNYAEVVRYVTGQVGIIWPERDGIRWIESGVEHEGRRAYGDHKHHYYGFHNIIDIQTYTEAALADADYSTDNWPSVVAQYESEHIGQFNPQQQFLFGHLAGSQNEAEHHMAVHAVADDPEPLTITSVTGLRAGSPVQLVNGIYPAEYRNLDGVPADKTPGEHFWASQERSEGDEYIEIDLGRVQAVNYVTFEVSRKSLDIDAFYDTLDLAPSRHFVPVRFMTSRESTTSVSFGVQEQNPWVSVTLNFLNPKCDMIFSRFIRIKLSRRNDVSSPFVDPITGTVVPWSVEVRNLRIGRVVADDGSQTHGITDVYQGSTGLAPPPPPPTSILFNTSIPL